MDYQEEIRYRYQDLSREQAYGLEARVLQRVFPLIFPSEQAKADDVWAYFSSLTELSFLLADIALGNLESKAVVEQARKLDKELDKPNTFEDRCSPLVYTIRCVTDALGDMNTVRYFVRPGLSERDNKNPDLPMLVAHAGFVLSKFGLMERVIQFPVKLDFDNVVLHRTKTEPFVGVDFFARKLWPDVNDGSFGSSMVFGFENIIQENWKEAIAKLGLSGVVTTYAGFINGLSLTSKHSEKSSGGSTINNYTVTFGDGATFTGLLAVGENIKQSYNIATSTKDDKLRELLETLVTDVSKLLESSEADEQKAKVSEQLKTFVDEAKKPERSKWLLNVSADGLIEAAKAVATLADPITKSVKAVLALVTGAPL